MKIKNVLLFLGAIGVGTLLYVGQVQYQKYSERAIPTIDSAIQNKFPKIVFSGGCFWCTEAEFKHLPGVVEAISGYAGGRKDLDPRSESADSPTYEQVSSGTTDYRESVLVYYNEASTTLDTLLVAYWKHIDPTDTQGQFVDRGHQYTSAIYYTTELQKTEALRTKQMIIDAKKFAKPIATEILPYTNFYPAEEYHQDYKDKNPARYEYYRNGSGRNDFINKNWKNDTTTFSLITTKTSMNTNNRTNDTTSSTTVKVQHPWQAFIKPTDTELHSMLTDEQYNVTQKEGTERPFTNAYDKNKQVGLYVDIVSGEPLYLSVDKYDSGTGWPSFVKPVDASAVRLKEDKGIFTSRTEVRSAIADSHLGHVFPDGPQDRGGKRYCMNSASMKFIPIADMEKEGYGDYIAQLK